MRSSLHVVYRILSAILHVFAIMVGCSLVFNIRMLLAVSGNLLMYFVLIAIILYTWFSNRFYKRVVLQQQEVQESLKHLVRVNGIVAIIYSILLILMSAVVVQNPARFFQSLQSVHLPVSIAAIKTAMLLVAGYALILLVHVVWTFRLMKRYAIFFQEQP